MKVPEMAAVPRSEPPSQTFETTHVFLVESDKRRRQHLATQLELAQLSVVAVGQIRELEQWPVGAVVITESCLFTPFWTTVGATHIVVLADADDDGIDACRRGATAWLPRRCDAAAVLSLLRRIGEPTLNGNAA